MKCCICKHFQIKPMRESYHRPIEKVRNVLLRLYLNMSEAIISTHSQTCALIHSTLFTRSGLIWVFQIVHSVWLFIQRVCSGWRPLCGSGSCVTTLIFFLFFLLSMSLVYFIPIVLIKHLFLLSFSLSSFPFFLATTEIFGGALPESSQNK